MHLSRYKQADECFPDRAGMWNVATISRGRVAPSHGLHKHIRQRRGDTDTDKEIGKPTYIAQDTDENPCLNEVLRLSWKR